MNCSLEKIDQTEFNLKERKEKKNKTNPKTLDLLSKKKVKENGNQD